VQPEVSRAAALLLLCHRGAVKQTQARKKPGACMPDKNATLLAQSFIVRKSESEVVKVANWRQKQPSSFRADMFDYNEQR